MKTKKNTYIIPFLLLIGIILTLLFDHYRGASQPIRINSNAIVLGSGQEISQKLKEINDSMLSKKIVLNYKGTSYTYSYRGLGFTTDYLTVANSITEESSLSKSPLAYFSKFFSKTKSYTIKYVPNDDVFKKDLSSINPALLEKSSNAHFEVIGDSLNIVDEKNGEDIDYKTLESNLTNCTPDNVSVPFIYNKPTVTASQLESYGITDLVSEFTTSFSGSSPERITNVAIAAKSVSNVLLAPNQVFSYNETIGETTTERGYKVGHVYENGQVVDGVGGGVCQVSTTLYNAVLYANLEIVERHNHQMPVSYVGLSRDATVSSGSKDFKFKNSSGSYIYLYTEIQGKTLTIKIFGKKSDTTVKLSSKLLETIQPPITTIKDSSLSKGVRLTVKHGQYGKKSQLIKAIYENGTLVKTMIVSTDVYIATPSTVRVGTKEVKLEQTTTDTSNEQNNTNAASEQNTSTQSNDSSSGEGSNISEPVKTE